MARINQLAPNVYTLYNVDTLEEGVVMEKLIATMTAAGLILIGLLAGALSLIWGDVFERSVFAVAHVTSMLKLLVGGALAGYSQSAE